MSSSGPGGAGPTGFCLRRALIPWTRWRSVPALRSRTAANSGVLSQSRPSCTRPRAASPPGRPHIRVRRARLRRRHLRLRRPRPPVVRGCRSTRSPSPARDRPPSRQVRGRDTRLGRCGRPSSRPWRSGPSARLPQRPRRCWASPRVRRKPPRSTARSPAPASRSALPVRAPPRARCPISSLSRCPAARRTAPRSPASARACSPRPSPARRPRPAPVPPRPRRPRQGPSSSA